MYLNKYYINLQTTTAAGRLIQNNTYIYDAVGNILQLTNNADPVSEENLYGGATTNSYSYDNRYQLINAEGSFTGNNKEHKYTMAMEYGATGKILRKTQSNQSRKNEGDWLTDAGTSMDYRYSYKGQKPHAVSSIIDNNTETLFTYTYDASGNNLLETNSKASSDREIVWTEDNRLAAIKAKGNVSHYVYDANGIRTIKMNSSGFNISINGVSAGTNGIDGNFTIYANPYTVVRENQCTKHFFLGSQRILTKISSSDVSHTFFEGHAQGQVGGVDYESKQTALEGNITINNKQLNIGWYRETRGRVPSPYIKHYLRFKESGVLSGNNPWGEGNNTNDLAKTATYEEKQYFFHPDHVGSSNYLTDVLGEAYQHVEYLPWGEIFMEERNTQININPYLYTGKELDLMTGLYYYEQRYYDPNKSYFLGVDQLTDKALDWTPYRYGLNNPLRFIDPNGQWEEEPDSPQSSNIIAKKSQQVENFRSKVAEHILNAQGLSVNETKLKAAGSVLDIKPIFKEVPVIGCKGPVSNYETEPILVGASIRLNIPSEFSNNNNVRELLKEVGEEVGSNVVEEVSQKIIENMAGVKINPKGANVVSMIFSFQEIGKGSSLTEQYQERVKIEQTQAIDAVINYHLNQFKHK